MSKMFTLKPNETEEFHANDFTAVTLNAPKYQYYPDEGSEARFFGYCTGGCGLKVFLTKPKSEGGDYFFKHYKGYYSEIEKIKMESCNNYKPSKGKREQPRPLPSEYLDEIFDFLKENAYLVYRYINSSVLNGVGRMKIDFFLDLIEDIFIKRKKSLATSDKISIKMLPYNILYLMFGTGRIDFPLIRQRKIDFRSFESDIEEKGIEFFNYFLFVFDEEHFNSDCLGLKVIKSHDYGVELDRPIVLHNISINIDNHGLYRFIEENKFYVKLYNKTDEVINTNYPTNAKYILQCKNDYNKVNNKMKEIFN